MMQFTSLSTCTCVYVHMCVCESASLNSLSFLSLDVIVIVEEGLTDSNPTMLDEISLQLDGSDASYSVKETHTGNKNIDFKIFIEQKS